MGADNRQTGWCQGKARGAAILTQRHSYLVSYSDRQSGHRQSVYRSMILIISFFNTCTCSHQQSLSPSQVNFLPHSGHIFVAIYIIFYDVPPASIAGHKLPASNCTYPELRATPLSTFICIHLYPDSSSCQYTYQNSRLIPSASSLRSHSLWDLPWVGSSCGS